jgi:xylan 1,4-beta-xylosidase
MTSHFPSTVRLSARTVGPALNHPWRNAIAIGRAFDLTRQDCLEHLTTLQREFGWRYCRFHAVFDDDMAVVRRRPDGSLAFQWRQVDQVYDALLAIGLRPFVELNPMPTALASGTQTMFDFEMNVTPPKDWLEWEDLIEAFARHLVGRYGLEEVAAWWFEVWNEPNLSAFWSGTKEDYLRLYHHAAVALKRVSPRLRVGGPASSKASWLEDLLHSGEPVDFISTHLYPQDEYVEFPGRKDSPHQPGAFFAHTVHDAVARVHAIRPGLPIHWTEWNAMATAGRVDWTTNATNDSLHGAATVVDICAQLDGALDSLCWWVASDIFVESGLSQAPYSMTYGLVTIHGIPKAAAQAFRLLHRLRGGRRELTLEGAPQGAGAIATGGDGHERVLLWNRRLLEDADPPTWHVRLEVPVSAAPQIALSARIGLGHGSAYETWLALGAPQNLSPSDEALLRAHAEPQWQVEQPVISAGVAVLELSLAPGEVLFLDVHPAEPRALPRKTSAAALAAWDASMGERSR